MMEVASPANGHPGPMGGGDSGVRRDSEDSVDRELDWFIQRAEASTNPKAADSPTASPTAVTTSWSPRGSPRSPPPPAHAAAETEDRYARPRSRTGAEDEEDTAPEYDEEEFDMSLLSDDQRQAMIELQNMRLDLAYTNQEDPPVYDVTERLRQLNAELADDPTPDTDRQRSITFQEDPVSLVVPPSDYSDVEDDTTATTQQQAPSSAASARTSSLVSSVALEGAETEEEKSTTNNMESKPDPVERQDRGNLDGPDSAASPRGGESPPCGESPWGGDSLRGVASPPGSASPRGTASPHGIDSRGTASPHGIDSPSDAHSPRGKELSGGGGDDGNKPQMIGNPSRTGELGGSGDGDWANNSTGDNYAAASAAAASEYNASKESASGGSQQRPLKAPGNDDEQRYSNNHDYEEPVQSDGDEHEEEEEEAKPNGGTEQEEEDAEATAETTKDCDGKSSEQATNQQQHDDNDEDGDDGGERVVVERNGTFEYMSVKNLTAEERKMYLPDNEEEEDAIPQQHEPKPPSGPRPSTANGTAAQRRHRGGAPRSTSAMGHSSNANDPGTGDNFTYQSPYAMTADERKRRSREQREHDQQKREEEQARRDQDERDKADSEDAFQGWLSIKRRQAQEKRKQDEEYRRKHQGDKEDGSFNDSAFKEWLKVKKTQKKEQTEEEKKRFQEYDKGYYVRSRSECQTAFKQWLRKKNSDLRKAQQDDIAKARVHKLLARKSRKSQQLARAIKQAQAFKYVDYYGYR